MIPLQTDPSSGIPAGLRKRPALDAEPTNGHAAGILFVAPDGDILLLRRSSTEPNYAGHWALPGGKAEAGESPQAAAEREAVEEMGRKPAGAGKVFDQRITPTGMAFHTFAYPVAEKFVPKLNEEHSGYAWAPFDQLPGPIHPGVDSTLKDRLGIGTDMIPEAWKALREGFLKWTLEEEAEPEHAGDSALALDRNSVRDYDADGRLHIKIANISKAAVNPYRGREIPDYEKLGLDPDRIYQLFRDPKELEKAAPTFNGIQVLRKHIPVNADDHQPWDVVGATANDAAFNAPYLQNGLVIWARDAIDDVESEIKKELSCGYRYRADMTAGNFNGMSFDGVMRDIVANHIALVKDGRAGPDVVVGDSTEGLMSAADQAKTIKAIANRTVSFQALSTYLKPRLAMDAKISLAKAFDGVTGATFKDSKAKIAASIKDQAKGKLAKDASLDDVEKVLGMLEEHEVDGGDASVSPEQHNAMEAAAHGNSTLDIPKNVGEEFVAKDNEGLKNFLKGKGMGEDDINTAMGMLPKPNALDESEEDKKKREEDEKKAADEAMKAEEEKKAKDAAMKDMVTKPAMDAAITAATEATAKKVRETERGIRAALEMVRPYVGELPATLAFDSADDVYREAAVMLEIPNAKTIHPSALPTIIGMQPKAGARPIEREMSMGMDSATVKSLNDRFGLDRIGAA